MKEGSGRIGRSLFRSRIRGRTALSHRRRSSSRVSCGRLPFRRGRRADVRKVDGIGGPTGRVVPASLGQRQPSIGPAADDVGIAVVLAVVFPEADGADFEPTPFVECEAAAAGTAMVRPRTVRIHEPCPPNGARSAIPMTREGPRGEGVTLKPPVRAGSDSTAHPPQRPEPPPRPASRGSRRRAPRRSPVRWGYGR